jgi:hypothetical protein
MTGPARPPLSVSELRAVTTELLQAGGYRLRQSPTRLPRATADLLEDPYGIVLVAVFDTWADLREGWPDAQAVLAELISENIAAGEPKAWDGYLVLLTPGIPERQDTGIVNDIRQDTSRLRKLIATGDDLRTLNDVGRVILPLLPLESDISIEESSSALQMLPDLLAPRGVEPALTRALIQAFTDQEPLIERLHNALRQE